MVGIELYGLRIVRRFANDFADHIWRERTKVNILRRSFVAIGTFTVISVRSVES